jgi:hypothetical protein
MHPKLKFNLIHRYQERGFAMPVAMSMGLIILLIAATLISRSQSDRVTAMVQKNTAQSLTVAEGGVARSLSKLKSLNNGAYLQLSYDPLNTAVSPAKTYLGPDGIPNSGDEETTAVNQWLNPPTVAPCATTGTLPSGLTSDSLGSGSYTIKAYRYRDPDGIPNSGDEVGTLLVEGQQGDAKSQVQVSVAIARNAVSSSFPGLYGSNSINLGNNDVLKVAGQTGSAANVICKNCTVPTAQCSAGQPTATGLASAVGKGPNSNIDGGILIGDPQIPPVPTAPTTACSSTSGANCRITLSSAISSSTTLPRSTDVTNRTSWSIPANTPYHYVISSIDLSGNETLTVNTSNAPVYLYVTGNVSMSGNAGIAHTGTPDRLRLYGNPADNNNSNDQSITINGGSSATNIFIYAPDATVGINGGSSDPDILGAVWAKTWNGSSSNNAEIRVPDNMPALLGGAFSSAGMQSSSLSAPSRWQRQPSN